MKASLDVLVSDQSHSNNQKIAAGSLAHVREMIPARRFTLLEGSRDRSAGGASL